MTAQASRPLATYRIQFNKDFTFRDATRLVPYLAELGISHLYASPYLRARPGSMHGYDIIDHNSLSPEIGTAEDYEQLVLELHRYGLGQVLDIVPNHMGVMGADNAWWLDVLENGEASAYAEYFDIDWEPVKDELQGKVLIPILGDQYGNVLERGELKLVFDPDKGEFSLLYFQHRFPINPREYPRILSNRIQSLEEELGATHDDVLELHSVITALGHLPSRQEITPERSAERNREKEIQKRRLAALSSRSPAIQHFVEENVANFNGTTGDSRSFDDLHELIKAQAYRLAQWRVAADDINYRRFFDINDLAALRMENDAVFHATHSYVLKLVKEGKLDGLRVDHPDGLHDPAKYFYQLQCGLPCTEASAQAVPSKPIYVVVEKILSGNERLRREWPVYGTTGYEFGNLVNGLFVDQRAATRVERIYRSFTGENTDYVDLVYLCKKLILKNSLASELSVLANLLSRIALANRHTCDFTLNALRSALAEVIACFPVYRTYVTGGHISSEDRRYVEQAVAAARRRSNTPDLTVFDFIRRMLLLDFNGDEPQYYQRAITRFAMKFQQVTSAVMAKGLEDTAFYRYNRLTSLNEVGGDPAKFGSSVEEFHRANELRLESWPQSMLSTSTHDSKRSEDVRSRIDVISEIPAAWRMSLRRWRDWNRSRKRSVDGTPAPFRNDEYLLYQSLLGAWPLEGLDDQAWAVFVGRIEQYMMKAMREAKEHTSWANPNEEYEKAVVSFIRDILTRGKKNRFLPDFGEFQRRIARIGMFNSLSQLLLKLTSPGVPDVYQGNEVWDFSLVDPDNRRKVDYGRRERMLRDLAANEVDCACQAADLLRNLEDGRIKLHTLRRTLHLRKQNQDLFLGGEYVVLKVAGGRSEHVCAFARRKGERLVITVVPRLCATLLGDKLESPVGAEVWGDTHIEVPAAFPTMSFRNVFTGEVVTASASRLPMSQLLTTFPVALLVPQSDLP